MRFTKWPWKWDVDGRGYTVGLFSEKNGDSVIELSSPEFGNNYGGRLEVVFFNEEDSSLIAAAPELYEALECVVNALQANIAKLAYKDEDLMADYMDKAVAVLKKARGE